MQSKERPAWLVSQKVIGFLALALCAALGLGLAGYLSGGAVNGDTKSAQHLPAVVEDVALSPVPVDIPSGEPQWTIGTLKSAMATCDAEAGKNPDGLYFLVTPVEPATFEAAVPILPPSGDQFASFFFITTPSLFAGLGNGSLNFSSAPYTFLVLDIKTANIMKWNSANGVSKFKSPKAAEFSKFKIGFTFDDNTLTWTNEYDRQKGTCYWVNLRFNGKPNLPHSGWNSLGAPKSFPSPAANMRCTNHVCERMEDDTLGGNKP